MLNQVTSQRNVTSSVDSASVSWRASATDLGVSGASVGDIARLACSRGAQFLSVRPSSRSFTKWVAVCYFSVESSDEAELFAFDMARKSKFPFCLLRHRGSWRLVSVPVVVREFPRGGGLPCMFTKF